MTNGNLWAARMFAGEPVRVLGLTLMHFLWEGLAIALLLFGLVAFCRSARTRYALGVGALMAMLLAPVVTFGLLWRAPVTRMSWKRPAAMLAITRGDAGQVKLASIPAREEWSAPLPKDFPVWCACGWAMGVFVFSLRTLGGWLVVMRLRKESARALPDQWVVRFRQLERRLGLKRGVQYLQSRLVDGPAVIGWLRPTVLLPMAALSGLSTEQVEAVIVHELAHIRRLDGLVNWFQVAAETLFFYHPAVWWTSRLIRRERENCCDDVSVEVCGNRVEYARALTVLEAGRAAPAWAMAATGGDLKARVMRLLKPERSAAEQAPGFGLGVLGVLCVAGLFVTAAAVARAEAGPTNVAANTKPTETVTAAAMVAQNNAVLTAPAEIAQALAQPAPPQTPATPEPIAAAPQAPEPPPSAPAAPAQAHAPVPPRSPLVSKVSYVEGLKAAGLKNLTVDQIIALKVQDVTPEYVQGVRASGFEPSVDELIGMKVQDITPGYVAGMRALGLQPSLEELVAMKVQDVTPDYVRDMQKAGLGPLRVRDLIAMKVQDVDAGYLRELRTAGLQPTAQELIQLKIQDVSPEFVRGLQQAGLRNLKIEDYLAAMVQDVTPEFVEKIRSEGFKDLDLRRIIALKNADVF